MTRDEKLKLADKFESAYAPIDALIAGLPDAALRFIPQADDAWSINDHLVHLLDGEAAVYFRLRNAIASPGATIQTWDEEAWHGKLEYSAMDGMACLAAAKALRAVEAATLRAIADKDWSGFWLEHPERGRLDLDKLVEAYRDHLAYHLPFIKRNRDAWKRQNG